MVFAYSLFGADTVTHLGLHGVEQQGIRGLAESRLEILLEILLFVVCQSVRFYSHVICPVTDYAERFFDRLMVRSDDPLRLAEGGFLVLV